MPWPDNFAISVTALVHGGDDRGRLMRRTLVRYINLSWILTLCSISTNAKKRFPTLDHIVEIANVIGAQFLEQKKGDADRDIDIYVPIFTILQYVFYMGWLKVAESLINPFGEDDDDFDTNWVFDRNIQTSYLIVDDMHSESPELIKDAYWDSMNFLLPYTAVTDPFKSSPYLGSAVKIEYVAQVFA
ncbi:hypothetical protein EB796_018152 [Bugula neritina]|uniref:Bestrophin homolog n=1 Tax=Bugula neritina TaxID=10212 RepID=A0A7J7JBV1_BUGNE|nr:hypothetical protein EB796_018152 [Bugula neritina]